MEKLSFWVLIFGFWVFVGCGSLDNSTSSAGGGGLSLKIQNPDESASGTAKAVEGPANDFAVSKAASTLSVSSCDITCGSNSKTVTFASGTSTVEATIDCPSQSSFTISATCADSSKTSNGVNFGFSGSTTVDLTTGDKAATISGVFLNQATRSSGDCRYARAIQDNNTQIGVECGFDSALTDAQKTTARCNIEYDAGNSGTSPATVDTSSDGLKSTATNPYIIIEGGVLNPTAFQYNTSGTKQLKGACTWETDGDSNTKAVCKFGVRQWRQFDSDRNFRFAASCTKDGSTYVLIPSSGMAEGKTSSASDDDVASLAADNSSCSNNRGCSSGFCAGSSLCAPAAPVGLAADVTDAAGPAGATTNGTTDGAATAARFDQPPDICLKPNGQKIYITDYNNHTLREINLTLATTDSAYVATPVGTAGTTGTTNGSCNVALLNGPEDCVVTADGNTTYISESGNDCIRKVDISVSPCQVTTFAGSCGTAGTADGTGATARFTNPKDLAIDGNGTLYVTDQGSLIRKITSAQVVTTFAGSASTGSADGTGTSASFNNPRGLALNSTGSFLYVADITNGSIRKVNTATQAVTTLVTSLTDVIDVTIEPTETFLYAAVGNTIRKITISNGGSSTLAGTSTAGSANGNGTSATFNTPEGIALDKEGDTLYVADTLNNKIRKIQ